MAASATHSELRLLFACARLTPNRPEVRELASTSIDWPKVADAAEYHGLTPLLLKNLREAGAAAPDDVTRAMEQRCAATVRQNLFLTSELLRVHASLKDRGIETVSLKGAVLASQIYGDLGLRPFSDIDLLIKREQISVAESAVREAGYEAEYAIPPQHRERWMQQQCELTFRHSGTIRLELHWDIAHPHFALETGVEGFWRRLTTVPVGDALLPNLSSQDLLFSLIVHGTRHAWSRMMWLVDVAELLRSKPGIDWRLFFQDAESRGAARMVATSLLLAQEAFGVRIENPAAEAAYNCKFALACAREVISRWDESLDMPKESDYEPTPLWRHRWIIQTRENRSQRWLYRRRVLTMIGEEEFGAVQLPGALSPLYNAVRFWHILRKSRPAKMAASAGAKN
jgi:hypothetical protein